MTTTKQYIDALKMLGAGDQQCNDCLALQAPKQPNISDCKKCIADTYRFTEQARILIASKKANHFVDANKMVGTDILM